ncbi:hypothetical protein [Paeniglutamicibacter kerguelensis]|uniref:Uncharacterized protein n=1 Tax=Paeniglutamicibacter kerguelensis TaxID=254788 RepID=A0ABS4X956_9MICC|nr:hypothetical protein [Paeniglutamicibacter kerguelensis]MBP2385000.1 hypothetical protein [Paeniglutamicibacter kerguelensis]
MGADRFENLFLQFGGQGDRIRLLVDVRAKRIKFLRCGADFLGGDVARGEFAGKLGESWLLRDAVDVRVRQQVGGRLHSVARLEERKVERVLHEVDGVLERRASGGNGAGIVGQLPGAADVVVRVRGQGAQFVQLRRGQLMDERALGKIGSKDLRVGRCPLGLLRQQREVACTGGRRRALGDPRAQGSGDPQCRRVGAQFILRGYLVPRGVVVAGNRRDECVRLHGTRVRRIDAQ